jgi:hypothetical protein
LYSQPFWLHHLFPKTNETARTLSGHVSRFHVYLNVIVENIMGRLSVSLYLWGGRCLS